MQAAPTITRNTILNSLDTGELERIVPLLERVDLRLEDELYQPDSPIDYVFFPDDSMISVVGVTPQGSSAEVAVIGDEGLAPVDAILGAKRTVSQLFIVQGAGGAHRVPVADVLIEFHRGGNFQRLVLHAIYRNMVQVSQTAVCNRLHDLDERLARWLLMCQDRHRGDTLELTQEFISFMVGATRSSVTHAAITLQSAGLISYKRGFITILDRKGLIDHACDCYKVVAARTSDLD